MAKSNQLFVTKPTTIAEIGQVTIASKATISHAPFGTCRQFAPQPEQTVDRLSTGEPQYEQTPL